MSIVICMIFDEINIFYIPSEMKLVIFIVKLYLQSDEKVKSCILGWFQRRSQKIDENHGNEVIICQDIALVKFQKIFDLVI